MLAPQDMTDDTLRANLGLYRAIHESQPGDLTAEDHKRHAELITEREARIAAKDTLPDGIYVAGSWAHQPESGLLWRRAHGRWRLLADSEEREAVAREATRTPQDFFGIGWEKQIVRLVAVSS